MTHEEMNCTLACYKKQCEEALDEYMARFTDGSGYSLFKRLVDAMRYSLTAGGKRLRPALVFAFTELFGGKADDARSYAAALEMVHTFSLIHDDMPCMDNDSLRRGKPTNHVIFGESGALLAGDALLAYAFETLPSPTLDDHQNLRALRALSHYSGAFGMCGGQQIDLENEGKKISLDALQTLHAKKTGALIKCACVLGCIAAGKSEDSNEYQCAVRYAAALGLAFQIADDILDVVGDVTKLGKNCGSDRKDEKNTYVTLLGLEESKTLAKQLAEEAKAAVCDFDGSGFLCALADYTVTRES